LSIPYDDKYAPVMMLFSKRDVANLLNEEVEELSVRESTRQKQKIQQVQHKSEKRKATTEGRLVQVS